MLQLLSQSITTIKLVFRFYMLHSIYKKDKRSFGMNSSQFQAFAKDCRLNQAGMNMVGVIFKTVTGQVINRNRFAVSSLSASAARSQTTAELHSLLDFLTVVYV